VAEFTKKTAENRVLPAYRTSVTLWTPPNVCGMVANKRFALARVGKAPMIAIKTRGPLGLTMPLPALLGCCDPASHVAHHARQGVRSKDAQANISHTRRNSHHDGCGRLGLVAISLDDDFYNSNRTQRNILAVMPVVGVPADDLGCDRGRSIYFDPHQGRLGSGHSRRPRPPFGGVRCLLRLRNRTEEKALVCSKRGQSLPLVSRFQRSPHLVGACVDEHLPARTREVRYNVARALDAAPELFFSREQEVLVKRIGCHRDLDPSKRWTNY